MSNKELYNGLPLITQTIQNRRLALAGHVVRHEEMAAKVLLWQPDVKRRRGRPCLTLKKLIEEEVGLRDEELLSAMRDRATWISTQNCLYHPSSNHVQTVERSLSPTPAKSATSSASVRHRIPVSLTE
ncbi:hypothetical protein Bbelb_391420 [Branchiostoma belcheri]|nr:hypothetical protein Bbelb_391420 [Branchiostoma belcheri]